MDLQKYKGVLFDFDYTLANSEAGIVKCFKLTFQQEGYPIPEDITIKRTIGMPMSAALTELTGVQDEAIIEHLKEVYTVYADQYMTDNTFLFPDTAETLKKLHDMGKTIAIISNKTARRIQQTLERDQVAQYVSLVMGSDIVKVQKPNPDGMRTAMEKLGLTPETTIYLGDNPIDAETAQRAGVDFAAVLTGNNVVADFEAYPKKACVKHLAELFTEA